MTLEVALACTGVFIFCAVLLGFFFGPTGERWVGGWTGFCVGLGIAFWSWVGFVASHFISKYW